jgi:hypothetical protein
MIPTEKDLKEYQIPFREPIKNKSEGNKDKLGGNEKPVERTEKPRSNFRLVNFIIYVVLLCVALGVVGYFAYRFGRQATPAPILPPVLPTSAAVTAPAAIPLTTAMPTSTSFPTNTALPISTDTPEPTLTTLPTNTVLPHITLPFTDNFANGVNPPWQVTSGNWIVDSTGATITIADINDPAGSIVLDDPSLANYILRVHVYSPHVLSANQGDLGVVVRYRSDHDKNLVFYMNSASRWGWGYLPSLMDLPFYPDPITSVQKANITSDATVEIDVSGNKFTAKVNGETYDSFTMSGYETGGIGLITKCGNVGSCPSFSNFSLTPLP